MAARMAQNMRHTCGTARSGSERSENTCAACRDDMKRSSIPIGYGDLMGEFQKQTASIGRRKK
jgi:hypothetical protein